MIAQRIVPMAVIFLGLIGAWSTFGYSEQPKTHRLVIHVSENNPATMNMALNNAQNAISAFEAQGGKVEVEIVAIGPGLHMLREDTSPVKPRIAAIAASTPSIHFSGCGNTRAGMQKAEGKEIALVPQATVVPAGIARLMELQEQGWTYARP